MRKTLILCAMILPVSLHAQEWLANGTLNNGNFGSNLGTFTPHPINIYTNNMLRARFTTGSALNSLVGNSGDDLRILDPISGGIGHLDMFTSFNNGGNETHIVFGSSVQVSGKIRSFGN